MKHCEFPIGYPTLLARETFAGMEPWIRPEDNPYKASSIVGYALQKTSKDRFFHTELQMAGWCSLSADAVPMNGINFDPAHITITKTEPGLKDSRMPN